eukprot:scaffold547_cov99-Isochrysis_galbana.AAC.2
MSAGSAEGSCSAWASRSAATTAAEAVSSAITRHSDGPASMSMATRPATNDLAAVTYMFPGPTTASHAPTGPAPYASAAMA